MKTVFTNGCFDVLHKGHIHFLRNASELGGKLIVGLNSDRSVRELKGERRPVNDEEAREVNLLDLPWVDQVIVFDELTPERLIREVKPDVLVKGADYTIEEIVGADYVTSCGGIVELLPILPGYSTTKLVDQL
jgi:rfaE bifunctional protein nucleotidyltransferase chain/domain